MAIRPWPGLHVSFLGRHWLAVSISFMHGDPIYKIYNAQIFANPSTSDNLDAVNTCPKRFMGALDKRLVLLSRP